MAYTISSDARVGEGCTFGHGALVEAGAVLGDDVILGVGSVVMEGTVLGDGVRVGPMTVLGIKPKAAAASRHAVSYEGPLKVGAGSVIGAGAVLYAGTEFEEECFVGDMAGVRERCRLGRAVLIGRGVIMEEDVAVAAGARIQSGAYITGATRLAEEVFIGPRVITTNDIYPLSRAVKALRGPTVEKGAAIGAGASLLSGIVVGVEAMVGMGAAVVTDVPARRLFIGVPARDAGPARVD